MEVDKRIVNTSNAFGPLQIAVFKDGHLSLSTEKRVYRACVISVLLYGSECWTPLRRDLKKLNSFHHRCVRTVLGMHRQPKAVGRTRLIGNSERAMGRRRNYRDKVSETTPGVVRTLSKNARASSPQDVPVWVAPTETTIWRPKKEMERPSQDGPEGSWIK